MTKLGLVLEGGGMRGAYTAGALAWLVDNQIEFDYGVGISAGAINLCSYLLKNKDYLYDISVIYTSDKKNVGIIPLCKEHRYVGYDYMFDTLLKTQVKYDTSKIKEQNLPMEFGLYDLNQEKTVFFNAQDLDGDLRMLKASCTLPIAGKIVDYNGHRFLDGGISIMIPIERSLNAGCDKNLVIITKPEGYTRKAASLFMQKLMAFNYPKYKKMVYDYTHRHDAYNKQMEIIQKEVEQEKCLLVRPSETIPVKRFSGDPENLKKLYDLGYQDMENRKQEIIEFVKK